MYCGGAHPSGGIASYLVWDLAQDKAIEPWRWIRGGQGKYGAVTPDALNRLITRRSDRQSDAECLEAIRSTASYLAYPARKGMVFSPMLPTWCKPAPTTSRCPTPNCGPTSPRQAWPHWRRCWG